MRERVTNGFFVDEDGVTVDIATLPGKGLYAALDSNSDFPAVMVCVASGDREGEVVGEWTYYHDLFEVKLALNGFVMKRYEGQDGLFFDKVVKDEKKDGYVSFNIVEYCSLQSDENCSIAEHRGKLQIAYGYTFDPGEEFDEAEIMRTGAIGDLEDHRSLIDPESDEGRELLEYAGITANSYDVQDVEVPVILEFDGGVFTTKVKCASDASDETKFNLAHKKLCEKIENAKLGNTIKDDDNDQQGQK